MKITKRQLKRIIKEEKAKILSEVYMDNTTIQDEIAKIDDAIDNLLSMGMDPKSLQDEMYKIADEVTTRDHGQWHDPEEDDWDEQSGRPAHMRDEDWD